MSDRLESLFTLAARVTAAASEGAVLAAIVDDGAELAGASAAVVGIVEGDAVRIAAAHGYPEGYLDPWQTFPLEAGTPMADVIASGEPVYCASREERDERWPVFRGTGVTGSEAFVVLPLAGQRAVLGALTLSYAATREFPPDERTFVEAFSAQCALALERTRATAAERQLTSWFAFLAEASKALGRSLDYAETLAEVGRLLVPDLGDWFACDLLVDGELELVAVAHADPTKIQWARMLRERVPTRMDAPTGLPNVLRTGRSERYESITDEMLEASAQSPDELELIRAIGLSSVMIVPLVARQEVIGALTLVWAESGHRYDADDLVRAEELAARVSSAIDNARLYGAQLAAYERERVTRERTQRLQRFTSRLAPALTTESVVEIAIDKAIVACHGATALIGLASADGKSIEVTVGGKHEDEILKHHVIPDSQDSVVGDGFRRREPIWVSERRIWERYPAAVGRPESLQAVAVVPIQTANRFFGVLAIAFEEERDFPEEERAFMTAIAGQTAQALDRARLYEEQRHIAHVLQQGLLPKTLPAIPGVEVATSYRAAGQIAETGGDFYDVFEAPEGHFVVIGDVCGKGPVAASLTALCRYTLRASSLRDGGARPAELLQLLNSAILTHANGEEDYDGEFASVTCVLLERSSADGLSATIASGGHPPTLVRRRSGEVDNYEPTGSLVGVRDDSTFSEYTVELDSGDLMFLHTDGLTDARKPSGERLGDDSVRRTLASLREVGHPDDAIAAFNRVLEGVEITDDIAVVAVRVDDERS
jgi:serine phosphatase RsbU (regulator of sigma subunit)